MKKIQCSKKEFWIDYFPMLSASLLIITFAILNKQTFLKTLPTLITLIVQILLVRANRFSFLLGGANACLYALANLSEGLYFSAISAAFISAPIQIFSFFRWSKNKKGNSVDLKRLSPLQLSLSLLVTLVGWGICIFAFAPFFENASYPHLDSLKFVLGIVVSVLTAFCFVESQYISLFSSALALLVWILLTIRSPQNFNFIIISVYNLFRIAEASVLWTIRYRRQKTNKKRKGVLI